MKIRWSGVVLMCWVFVAGVQAQTIAVDERIAPYEKVRGLAGNASSIGSDTMNNMMALWLEAFRKYYPNVKIQIEGKGSSTAPPALIEGTAQFGPMSRPMKSSEEDKFEQAFGYKPTPLRAALDALAVFVNKDNPIEGLSLPQVDAIFSKTRRSEFPNDIASWGELGLEGDWTKAQISLYGRNSASGTYGFFQEASLVQRRLQGRSERAARLGLRSPRHNRGSLRHRIQRYWLSDLGCARRALGQNRGAGV